MAPTIIPKVKFTRKAFSIIEFALLIVLIVAVFFAMQYYLKRAVMGAYRQAADTFGAGRLYGY